MNQIEENDECSFCDELLTEADAHDSRQNGTLPRCRKHLIELDPCYKMVWEE